MNMARRAVSLQQMNFYGLYFIRVALLLAS